MLYYVLNPLNPLNPCPLNPYPYTRVGLHNYTYTEPSSFKGFQIVERLIDHPQVSYAICHMPYIYYIYIIYITYTHTHIHAHTYTRRTTPCRWTCTPGRCMSYVTCITTIDTIIPTIYTNDAYTYDTHIHI
jgi:hypothetical protein